MPIPDFQTLMLPLLKLTADGQEHSSSEVIEKLAVEFHLTPAERDQLLPSGRQAKFENRVGWTKTHLSKACLIEMTGRGRFRITPRGQEALAKKLPQLNMAYLLQFPEFKEFRQRDKHKDTVIDAAVLEAENQQTPEELLESSYQNLRSNLAQNLLERVKKAPARFFEQLVVELLVAMGYGGSLKDAGEATRQSGDEGIDGIIKEDKLGLDFVYIQAKRWQDTVGRPIVQAFAGSLEGQRARKGVLITTSRFSNEAKAYVERIEKRIVLVDGEQLAQLMIDYNVGVTEAASYVVKRIDADYFDESE